MARIAGTGAGKLGNRWIAGDLIGCGWRARATGSRASVPGTVLRSQADHVDDRRRQITQADGLSHNTCRVRARGRHDQERHADLGAVKALAMLEEIVLTQSFAMIGGDHDPCPIEHAATLQIVKQLTESARPDKQGSCRRNPEPTSSNGAAIRACR